jgi:hypothetical protein
MFKSKTKGTRTIGEATNIGGYFFWHVKSLLWFLLIRTKLKLGLTITTKVGFFYFIFKTKPRTWGSTYLCVEPKLEPKYMSLKKKVIRVQINW